MTTKQEIWRKWTDRYIDTENPVPLFETNEKSVALAKQYQYFTKLVS